MSFRPAATEQTRGGSVTACSLHTNTQTQHEARVIYSVRCAAAAQPQDRAHVLARWVPRSGGPSHRGERLKAASTLPVQKCPAASVSPFLLVCLEEKKKMNAMRISMREHAGTAHFRCVCSQSVCLPWSDLQSTTSTCASRCCLALAQRARDRVLFPLPCEETATRVKIHKTMSAHHIGSTKAQMMFLSIVHKL